MVDQTPHVKRRRRRPPRSCDECRRRKIKCNRQMPCNHCTATSKHCIFSSAFSRPAFGDEIDTGPFQRIGPQVMPPQALEPEPAVVDPSGSNTVLTGENVTQNLPGELHESSRAISKTCPAETGYAPNPVVHGAKPVLNKSRLFGRTHWTNDVPEFRRISEYMNIETDESTDTECVKSLKSEIRVLLQKCKLLAKEIKNSRPTSCLPTGESHLPNKYITDTMTRSYISHFESAFRILHIPSLWTEYESYWQDPKNASESTKFKIQLVIALGSSIHSGPDNLGQAQLATYQWVYAAQAWVSAPMEKDRIGISGLQIQCLLILARQCLSISGNWIWVAMGTLVRTAMQMGLHLDSSHFNELGVLEAELRRRLWATIMELNVQASLDSGMPPIVSMQDFDTKAPMNLDDADINDSILEISPKPPTIATDSSLQIFLCDCLRPRLDILRMMNGIKPDMSQDEVVALTMEISSYSKKCQNLFRHDMEDTSKVFRYNMADLLIRRFLLSLHRPWACRVHASPLFYYSRKVSYDTATALLSPLQDDNFNHLLLRGSGIFKNRFIHVSFALASELLIDIEEKGHRSMSQNPWDYRSMLVSAVQEARSQAAKRMERGETNVKLHMKLSIVLGQIETSRPEKPLKERMIRSARDSLQMSYSTIRARMGLPASPRNDGAGYDMEDFSPLLDFDDFLNAADLALDEATTFSSSIF